MTTQAHPNQPWSSMPGWGIVADLTPPELIASRHLKVLRKWIATGLVIMLLACVAGYVLATQKRSSASNALESVQARTAQLEADARKYGGITKLQGTVTAVQAQVSQLMSGDVDLVKLMGGISSSLPATMTIKQEAVTISLAGAASSGKAGTTTSKSGSGLDTSGNTPIGNVTISGVSHTLDDLAVYVDRLAAIPGVVDVVPLSNVVDATGVQYSVSLTLTDKLLSHRFDVSKNGGK